MASKTNPGARAPTSKHGDELPRDANRKRGGMAPVKSVLATYLRDHGIGPKLRDARVLRAWQEVVAPTYGTRVRATRFRDGELLVETNSAAHLQELTGFTGEELRRAANRRLGSERIRRVTFKLAR